MHTMVREHEAVARRWDGVVVRGAAVLATLLAVAAMSSSARSQATRKRR